YVKFEPLSEIWSLYKPAYGRENFAEEYNSFALVCATLGMEITFYMAADAIAPERRQASRAEDRFLECLKQVESQFDILMEILWGTDIRVKPELLATSQT